MKNYEIIDTGSTIKRLNQKEVVSSIVYRIIEIPEKYMYLHSAGTKPEEREKGHFRDLLNLLEQKCLQEEIHIIRGTIEEDNITMKKRMNKLGYSSKGYENEMQKNRKRLLIEKIL